MRNRAPHPSAAQPDLFDHRDDAITPVPAAALVAIALPAQAMSKGQRSFNRLVEQIRVQRELLTAWQAYETRYHQRLATEQAPRHASLRAARLGLLRLLDEIVVGRLPGPKLGKRQRGKLLLWIPQVAGGLLEEAADAEIEAIFDRYSDVSHAQSRKTELAEAEALFGQVLGEDAMQGHQAQTLDELMQHAAERVAAKAQAQQAAEQAEPARPARRKTSAKARQAESARQRQEAEAQQAGQSVREIFRKLASALHPDREPDPAERQRKTLLMQQANLAYARNDLLTLLTMQLQQEQIDSQHLASLPEDRLRHYNQVLSEQLAALQQEVAACAGHYLDQLGPMAWGREPVPATVDAALTLDMQALDEQLRQIQRDLVMLRDPASRRAVIDEIEIDDSDDEPDAVETMLMMEAMADALKGAKRRHRRG